MDNSKPFRLQCIRDHTFSKEQVGLSGYRYERCKFIECTLLYVGGPGEMSDCYLSPNTVWQFGGPVPMILETLQRYGFRLVPENGSPDDLIRFPSDAM